MQVTSPFDWLRVGHWTDPDARTGCTAMVFDGPVVASGEVRGGAPATREFALLDPGRTVESVDAVMLSGGSAFGLAAADGAVAALEAAGRGFETPHGRVPIVVAMSLYDLGVGDAGVRPTAERGRLVVDAVLETESGDFDVGAVGAGAGATVGKWRGPDHARASGLGWAEVRRGDLVVGALMAVNAAGDPTDRPPGTAVVDEVAAGTFDWPAQPSPPGEHTTIGVVVTNAEVAKTACHGIARAAHHGLARAIVPSHTHVDGDAIVAVARPEVTADPMTIQTLAAVAVERAVGAAVPQSGTSGTHV